MSAPVKGTPEYELWLAAIEVAIDPPVAPRGAVCQVHVARIEALRAALGAVGIDWRSVKDQS